MQILKVFAANQTHARLNQICVIRSQGHRYNKNSSGYPLYAWVERLLLWEVAQIKTVQNKFLRDVNGSLPF